MTENFEQSEIIP